MGGTVEGFECLFCGCRDAAKIEEIPRRHPMQRQKYQCADASVCEAAIQRRILIGRITRDL